MLGGGSGLAETASKQKIITAHDNRFLLGCEFIGRRDERVTGKPGDLGRNLFAEIGRRVDTSPNRSPSYGQAIQALKGLLNSRDPHMVSTTRNCALPLSIRVYASAARSSG